MRDKLQHSTDKTFKFSSPFLRARGQVRIDNPPQADDLRDIGGDNDQIDLQEENANNRGDNNNGRQEM